MLRIFLECGRLVEYRRYSPNLLLKGVSNLNGPYIWCNCFHGVRDIMFDRALCMSCGLLWRI